MSLISMPQGSENKVLVVCQGFKYTVRLQEESRGLNIRLCWYYYLVDYQSINSIP